MSDATYFPTLNTFQWSRPDNENPRLAAPISSSATTIVVTNAAQDEDGAVITGSFLMGIKNEAGYTESVWIPAASSTDGLTFASCIRGIDLAGLDNDTNNTSGNAVAHEAGEPVFCQQSGVTYKQMIGAMAGTIASGGVSWMIGKDTDVDITVYAANSDTNKPFFRYDADYDTTGGWVYSDDGSSSTPFGTGAGVTGGDGITVTAGDIDVDLTDVTTFRTTRNGNEQIGVTTEVATGLIDSTFMPSNLQAIADTGSTDVTGTELETQSDGSDAGALHHHAIKIGTDTWAVTGAAQTNTVAHGLGRVPKMLTVHWGITSGGTLDDNPSGTFMWDGTTLAALQFLGTGGAGNGQWEDNSAEVRVLQTSAQIFTFTVTTLDATNFVFTSADYTGAGTLDMAWKVE